MGKKVSQYHKHIIVTVFTAYALQKPAWNLLKIDATDLEKQKNEKVNKILFYCDVTLVSETWVCIDKQHAIKIAKAVANFFLFESELTGSLKNLQTISQNKRSKDVFMASAGSSVGNEVAESEAAKNKGIKMCFSLS